MAFCLPLAPSFASRSGRHSLRLICVRIEAIARNGVRKRQLGKFIFGQTQLEMQTLAEVQPNPSNKASEKGEIIHTTAGERTEVTASKVSAETTLSSTGIEWEKAKAISLIRCFLLSLRENGILSTN